MFEVKNVGLNVSYDRAFNYLSNLDNLPQWTHAFAEVKKNGEALMRTAMGEIPVKLSETSNRDLGTIDTLMTFPDNSKSLVHSRLVALDNNHCAYSFLLTPPPLALENIEGEFAKQCEILERELAKLKSVLEA